MSSAINPFIAFLISLSFLSCHTEENQDENQSPNIIFIIVDDMGYADLSSYGQTAYQTPTIDRMAREGMRFTRAYSGCTVCAPARSTLMSGQHMGRTPVRGNTGGIALPSSTVTVAEVLKQAGYTCGGFGKWGIGDLDTEGVPEKQGFDRFVGYYHQIHAHYHYPEYLIDTGNKIPLSGNVGVNDPRMPNGPVPETINGKKVQFAPYRIFDEMKAWIQDNKDRPFFCYAPLTPPHGQYHIPENDPAWQAVKDRDWPVKDRVHAAFNLLLDRHMNELFTLLTDLEIDQNTIVFFCSDNGAAERFEGTLNSSGSLRGYKRAMYEGGIRVPMIARWPGHIQAQTETALPTYFPDILPTLAELAGASEFIPEGIDGISIAPTLSGQPQSQTHDFMYWEWPAYNWGKRSYTGRLMQGVLHNNHKLVRHNNADPWELYDLTTDPGEMNNIADSKPDLVTKMDQWVQANRREMIPQVEPQKVDNRAYR